MLSLGSCNRAFVEDEVEPIAPSRTEAPVYMSASVGVRLLSTAATLPANATLSQKAEVTENEVEQLRILAFNSATGQLALNKYYGEGEKQDFQDQTEGVTAVWRGAFQLAPAQYDFFFIANEKSWPAVSTALGALAVGSATRADLYTNEVFKRIAYPDASRTFKSKSGSENEHLFLATRIYNGITVASERNGKGRTQQDPQHFIADGDEKVELIRTLAKVKVTIPNSALAEDDGNGGYRVKTFLPSRITKITLKDELPNHNLFLNPYFSNSGFAAPNSFSANWYNDATKDAKRDYVLYDRTRTTTAGNTGLSDGVTAEVKVPTSEDFDPTRRYDCTLWFYVPEHLLKVNAADPATPGSAAGSTGIEFNLQGTATGSRFGIWQSSFAEGRQAVDANNSVFFELPNQANYSKYSVVRNNVYDINVKYNGAQLTLNYKVLPWCNPDPSGVYVQDAFNVFTVDPAFSAPLTDVYLTTTSDKLMAGNVLELRAKTGYKFVDTDGAEKDAVTYGSGADELQFRHRRKVQLKAPANASDATKSAVALGTDMFDVYINGKLFYTVTAAEK